MVSDTDGDGIDDDIDNCLIDANPDQQDLDTDGIGDVCDDDCIFCADVATGITTFPIEMVGFGGPGFISGVVVNGVNAMQVDGLVFREENQEISVQVNPGTGESVPVISNGSSEFVVQANVEFDGIFVRMGTDMDFFVQLPQPTTTAIVIVVYSSFEDFPFIPIIGFQVQDSNGFVGQEFIVELDPQDVGSGELQVSVSWDQPTDVDLFLQEPSGNVIFFDNVESPTGGMLNLDSNPACNIDGLNNENIIYPDSTPPSGTYQVAVNYYDNCSIEEPTNYVVTVRVNNETTSFTGSLLPSDANNFDDSSIQIVTQFTLP